MKTPRSRPFALPTTAAWVATAVQGRALPLRAQLLRNTRTRPSRDAPAIARGAVARSQAHRPLSPVTIRAATDPVPAVPSLPQDARPPPAESRALFWDSHGHAQRLILPPHLSVFRLDAWSRNRQPSTVHPPIAAPATQVQRCAGSPPMFLLRRLRRRFCPRRGQPPGAWQRAGEAPGKVAHDYMHLT